jgi:hypothetical protein
MRKMIAFSLVGIVLSGCQTGTVSYETAILADSVYVTNEVVATNGPTIELSATDCKRVIEDDAPAAGLALNRLKSKAAQSGFNSIHSVTVQSAGGAALLANCWSQIIASGIAYNR